MNSLRLKSFRRNSDHTPRSLLQSVPLTSLAKAIRPTKSWWRALKDALWAPVIRGD
jgi:hypothetical protein